jgi:hypothetical protein
MPSSVNFISIIEEFNSSILASWIFPAEFIPTLAPPRAALVMLEAGVELFLGGAGRAALDIKFKKKQE